VIGERLVVGKELFVDSRTGALTANKQGLGKWLLMIADALKRPDEIWTRIDWVEALKKAVARRRYLARFKVDGDVSPTLIVVEVGTDGWASSVTPDNGAAADGVRQGIRLYQRQDK